jgi:hypothetical protein
MFVLVWRFMMAGQPSTHPILPDAPAAARYEPANPNNDENRREKERGRETYERRGRESDTNGGSRQGRRGEGRRHTGRYPSIASFQTKHQRRAEHTGSQSAEGRRASGGRPGGRGHARAQQNRRGKERGRRITRERGGCAAALFAPLKRTNAVKETEREIPIGRRRGKTGERDEEGGGGGRG